VKRAEPISAASEAILALQSLQCFSAGPLAIAQCYFLGETSEMTRLELAEKELKKYTTRGGLEDSG
jgi:hypothetical protein